MSLGNIDLANLSEKELKALLSQTQKELKKQKTQKSRRLKPNDPSVTKTIDAIKDEASKAKVDTIELLDVVLKRMRLRKKFQEDVTSTPKRTMKVKYRDPNNSGNTWTGAGHRPKWLKEKLSHGMKLEDFLV